MKAREVISIIERNGGQFVRQRGSHRLYRLTVQVGDHHITCHTTVAGHGAKDIPSGTLSKIERDLAPLLGKGWLK